MIADIPYQMSFLAVLVSSLIGSPHCAAMCGGFVTLVNMPGSPRLTQSLYHFGRLCTYLLLGAAFGALGHTLDQGALRFGISNAAAVFVGLYLVATGIRGLSGKTENGPHFMPGPIGRFFAAVIRGEKVSPPMRAYLIGLFTTFLPCGWLYTFAALAALSGSAVQGMVLMAAFWLGTVPILGVIGEAGRHAAKFGWRVAPRTTYALITAVGVATLAFHLIPHDHSSHAMSSGAPIAHGSGHEHSGHGVQHQPEQQNAVGRAVTTSSDNSQDAQTRHEHHH